jgi:hypothetical protein
MKEEFKFGINCSPQQLFSHSIIQLMIVGYILFTGCAGCISYNPINRIKGNGNLITSEKPVSAFEGISVEGSAEVRFHASEEYKAVVTVDENLDQYVEVFTSKNVLTIHFEKNSNVSYTKFLVDVYCPLLNYVSVSGSADLECVDKIVTPKFTAKISGSGKMNMDINCEDFSWSVSGSGSMTVTGTAQNAFVKISGSGSFNGHQFITSSATVSISGSGNITVYAEEKLDAIISGSGDLKYYGSPKDVHLSASGSGRITKMNE